MDLNGAWSHRERQETSISLDFSMSKVLQNRHKEA